MEYLNTKITKDDIVAILLYSSRVNVLSDFTGDRDQLTGIIKTLPIGEMSELAGLADDGSDDNEDTGAAFVADETEFNIFNTDRKLQGLEQASRMLAALPEKKSLIYFAGGVSKTGVDNQAQLEATVTAAAKANVAIYPIDARDLMADPPAVAPAAGQPAARGITPARPTIRSARHQQFAGDAGHAGCGYRRQGFSRQQRHTAGITQAQQELRSYYVIGYYSGNSAMDGKFRKITVKLANKLDAKLEHRQGYYAGKNWGRMTGRKEQQLTEAITRANR